MIKLINGEALEELKKMDENSVDAVVTDPPYGLSFMGKKWDYDVPSVELWKEALRVLKPGGHLLSFAGSRTYHRMAVNIEDGGFEIRDQIMWVYGSGFPKSHNIALAIDKKRGITGNRGQAINMSGKGVRKDIKTSVSKKNGTLQEGYKSKNKYEGWGTALKPAHEPIVVARKPLSEKTIAANVLKWGTGGINIDASRVQTDDKVDSRVGHSGFPVKDADQSRPLTTQTQGRFPANFIHDGSDDVVELFPDTKGGSGKVYNKDYDKTNSWKNTSKEIQVTSHNDSGSAARFFYCAKASKAERNNGLDGFEKKERVRQGLAGEKKNTFSVNSHPTVKPIKLMQYLIKLVTPKDGIALDPFMGSGTTGIAAKKEGFSFTGIEREEEYCKIAQARIDAAEGQKQLNMV